MEPAAEGREHLPVMFRAGRGAGEPQWSPPLKGGSTARKI